MSAAVLLILVVSAATAFSLTPLVRGEARRRGWLDRPDGGRKLHPVAVPRLGGIAVFGGFGLAAALLSALQPVPGLDGPGFLHLLLASSAVLGVGILDDVRGARPSTKLAVQAAAALYLFWNGYSITRLSNPFDGEALSLGWLSLPLTLLWFVGVSNAFNLIDGLDGLATGLGLFATTTLFVAAVLNERWETALLATALGGALLGFLRYNLNPATIFLGDSGALFVGFVLAAIAVRGHVKSSAAIAVTAPLLALALPLLDTGIAVVRRLLSGRRVFEPDVDHIHHRLLRSGLAPNRVVALLYAVAAFFGALSLLTVSARGPEVGLVVIAMSGAAWLGLAQLRPVTSLIDPWTRRSSNRIAARFDTAADLDQLWSVLVETAAERGFTRVELFGSDGARPRLLLAERAGRLPAGFPVWRARGPETSEAAGGAWRVPLVGVDVQLGSLTLSRPLQARARTADLFEAIERSFAQRWIECLDAAVARSDGPAVARGVERATPA